MEYSVTILRTATRSATISVEASSIEEAHQIALQSAGSIDYSSEKTADYEIDGFISESKKVRALSLAVQPFLSGETPLKEYKELIAAQDSGKGDELAHTLALVWQPLEHLTVDEVLKNIHLFQDKIAASL